MIRNKIVAVLARFLFALSGSFLKQGSANGYLVGICSVCTERSKRILFGAGNWIPKVLGMMVCVTCLAACSIAPVEKNHFKYEGGVADFDGIKIAVGQRAPDFTLPDVDGKLVNLSSFQGKKHVLLVVYRGNWCPYCMSQLDSFESLLPLLGRYDIQLVGVSPDFSDKVKKTKKKFDDDYIFLSDKEMSMIDLYGLRKDAVIPHPATILINRDGEVVWFYASSNYKVRPDAMQMRKIIGKHLRTKKH